MAVLAQSKKNQQMQNTWRGKLACNIWSRGGSCGNLIQTVITMLLNSVTWRRSIAYCFAMMSTKIGQNKIDEVQKSKLVNAIVMTDRYHWVPETGLVVIFDIYISLTWNICFHHLRFISFTLGCLPIPKVRHVGYRSGLLFLHTSLVEVS